MKGGNRLDQLVQRAQEQAPEIDLADVHQIVSTVGSANPVAKSTFLTLKTLLLMTSITTVIIAVIALWPEPTLPEQIQEPSIIGTTETQEGHVVDPFLAERSSSISLLNETMPLAEKGIVLDDTSLTPAETKSTSNRREYFYEDYEERPAARELLVEEPFEPQASTKPVEILENEYFELSKDEWKSLHVSMSKRLYVYEYSDVSNSFMQRVRISANMHNTSIMRTGSREDGYYDEIFLPLGLSKSNRSLFTNIRFQADKLADSLRKTNQVIVFKMPMRGSPLAWYSMNDALYEALPLKVRQVWDSKVLQYDEFEVKHNPNLVGRMGAFLGVDSSLISHKIAYDETMAVFANTAQMEKLGVAISDTAIEIEGRVKRGTVSFKSVDLERFFISTDYSPKLGGAIRKRLDHVPIFISRNRVDGYITSFIDHAESFKGKNFHQLFLNSRHAYLPVVYSPPSSDSSIVFWYEPSTELLQEFGLSHQEQAERIEMLIEQRQKANLMETETFETLELQFLEEEGEQLHKTKLLQLDQLTLARLKIFVEDEKVTHISNFGKSVFSKEGMYQELHLDKKVDSANDVTIIILPGHSNLRYPEAKASPLSPKYITDDLARNWKAAATPTAEGQLSIPYGKMDSFVAHNLRTTYLIPVLVRSGQKYTKLDEIREKQRPDCIFWFEPNDSFLAVLPSQLATSIRSELVYAAKKEEVALPFEISVELDKTAGASQAKAPSCQFFEACETRKLAITEHSIYPNPTHDRLNVSIASTLDCRGNISIVDIQGKVIAQSEIVLKKQLTTHFNFSLAGIEEGIYIVNLQTSAGDYISQRVVKVN